MDLDPRPEWALEHYSLGMEAGRLTSGQGLLELERTQELLLRYLPSPPARIADIGAAAGARGVRIDSAVADARILDIMNESVDAVLLKRIGEGEPGFAAVLDAVVETGMLPPLEPRGFTAFCHRPEQLCSEAEEAGPEELALLPVEGPGAYLSDLEERWATPVTREVVLDAARRVEGEIPGIGPHLMLVARRP